MPSARFFPGLVDGNEISMKLQTVVPKPREGAKMKFTFKKPSAVGFMLLMLLSIASSVTALQEEQTKTEQERNAKRLIASVKGLGSFSRVLRILSR
jgi:hypothetical protein